MEISPKRGQQWVPPTTTRIKIKNQKSYLPPSFQNPQNPNSCHPEHIIKNIPRSQLLRLARLIPIYLITSRKVMNKTLSHKTRLR